MEGAMIALGLVVSALILSGAVSHAGEVVAASLRGEGFDPGEKEPAPVKEFGTIKVFSGGGNVKK